MARRDALIGCGVLLSMALAVAANLDPSLETRALLDQAFGPRNEVALRHTALDRYLAENLPEGNVFLRFRGFDAADEQQADFASRVYTRANYALYPRRAYAAEDGYGIDKGSDVLAGNFEPEDGWLRARGVQMVLTVTRGADGSIGRGVRRLDRP